jgi:hypothetical protein
MPKKAYRMSSCQMTMTSPVSDNARDWEGKEKKGLSQQHKRERESHQSRKSISSNKASEGKLKQPNLHISCMVS